MPAQRCQFKGSEFLIVRTLANFRAVKYQIDWFRRLVGAEPCKKGTAHAFEVVGETGPGDRNQTWKPEKLKFMASPDHKAPFIIAGEERRDIGLVSCVHNLLFGPSEAIH